MSLVIASELIFEEYDPRYLVLATKILVRYAYLVLHILYKNLIHVFPPVNSCVEHHMVAEWLALECNKKSHAVSAASIII